MRLNPTKQFFVCGTDTGIGKTMVTKIIISELIRKGHTAVGCKPIACGSEEYGEDALVYQTLNSVELPSHLLNPLLFELPVSPNIAAKHANQKIEVSYLVKTLKKIKHYPIDYVFFEGLGGCKVPLNDSETTLDLMRALDAPALLIVGIRVGCLNHALMSWDVLRAAELKVAGWVANLFEPNAPLISDHIETLKNWITAPYLGMVSHQYEPKTWEHNLDFDRLLHEPFIQPDT